MFQNEFENLKNLKHQNIVQVFGYCYETTQGTPLEFNGITVQTVNVHRALCMEYMHNGSLHKYLSDESDGLEWIERYTTIKGICQGLKYIHDELEKPFYHLDLKPDNILLDKDMVPKIADFGLSMPVSRKGLTINTETYQGTLGYQPPEHIKRKEISDKFDIFSLGVIMIKILSGHEGRSKYENRDSNEAIDDLVNSNVQNWETRWQEKTPRIDHSLIEAYRDQVKTCTEIALNCIKDDSEKRPVIAEVIDKLNKTETRNTKERCHIIISEEHNPVTNTNMRNELNVITIDEEPSLNFMRDTMYSEHEIDYIRETSLDVGEELIIGRNEEKMKIVASLLQRRLENIIILPIFGMGGIGKTTFAKFIYDDDNFRSYARVWVRVSQRFDLKAIREDIKSQIPENKETKSKGSGQVTQLLSGEKVLIVLDDLWEEDTFQLEDLRTMLTNIGKSVKIVLVTTRSESIADKMYATLRPYNIASLTDGMCWEIMKHKSLFEYRDDKEQLRGIGCDIAMKCGGIPLAAQSLGFMLKSMAFDEWTKVRDSDIWKESISKDANLPNHVLASLKLSYTNMGDRCLKECFTYCSIFHEDEPIFKDNLIHQWISLGFIKPTKMHSIMQLCEKYFAQLVGLSFLQLRQRLSSTKGYVTYFSMHDLVHDLAKIVMADPSKQGITGERSCRYVLLTDCSKPLEESTSFPDNIRALRYFNSYKNKLVGSAVSSARSLKVLDFVNCSIGDELPGSIGELEQLRYLNATLNGNYERSNCFNKLSKLIYLILKECNMTALPESICEIRGLMHLDISGCSMIKELPKSFVKLKKLVHLDLSDCSTLRSGVSEALVGLTNMQHLNVSGLGLWNTYGFYQISPLYGLPELLRNLTELRYLGLGEVISSILWKWDDRIEYLPLNVTIIIDDICRTLPNLEHLDLSKNIFLVSLPESIEKLKKLHTLNLSLCLDLVRLPECIGNMGSLRILNVDGCKKLDLSMLSGSNIGFMVHGDGLLRHANPNDNLQISRLDTKSVEEVRSLKLIEKQDIIDLKLEWNRGAQRFVEDENLLGELVPPTTLRYFEIKGYNSMSFPWWVMAAVRLHLPNLTKITMFDLPKCNELPPLGQLPKLKELFLEGMDRILTIGEDFCGGPRAFPRLKKFHLCRMENLEAWNTVCYDTEMDGVEGEFMFPKLKELRTLDCPKLRIKPCPPRALSWEIENSDNVLLSSWRKTGDSPLLRMGVIVRSSKMPFEQWRLFDNLRASVSLSISKCSPVLTRSSPLQIGKWLGGLTCCLPEIIRDSSFIKSLSPPDPIIIESVSLEDSDELQLPKWLGGFVRLQQLYIEKWIGLSDLHKSMQHLTSLQVLQLKNCSSITTLPECLCDLADLRRLMIHQCAGIKSLPPSLHKLTKLNYLHISGCKAIKSLPLSRDKTKLKCLIIRDCPGLAAWCQLRETRMKLCHIKAKYIDMPWTADDEDVQDSTSNPLTITRSRSSSSSW